MLGSVLKVQAVFSHIKAFFGEFIQALSCCLISSMSLINQISGSHSVSYVPQPSQQLEAIRVDRWPFLFATQVSVVTGASGHRLYRFGSK